MISPSMLPLLVAIATFCALFGKATAGNARGGFLAAIGIGLIGEYAGTWAAQSLALPRLPIEVDGHPFSLVWALVGGTVSVSILHMFSKRY